MTVYLALGKETGLVKIGYSRQACSRVHALSSLGSDKLELLRVVPGNRVLEQWFHARFKDHRCHGEWFKYSPLMETIEIPDGLEIERITGPSKDCTGINVQQRIYDAVAAEYGDLRKSSERAARDACVLPRAAQNWLSRTNAPNGEALIHLMASNNSFASSIHALVRDVRAAREELRK